jgi:SPP1 family predicted phage head-tail adaptor
MFEGTAILKKAVVTQDEALNEIETYTERTVFVRPRSVYASEFYQAAAVGLKPSLTLVLASFADYDGEKLVEYNGKEYTVTRTYQRPDRDSVELTLEEREVNGIE